MSIKLDNEEEVIRVKKTAIMKIPTDCCALAQLSMTNAHTEEQIKNVLNKLKKEAEVQDYKFTGKEKGQRAVFVITTPYEMALANRLEKIGFQPVFVFERRKGYPGGKLTMWCYNL